MQLLRYDVSRGTGDGINAWTEVGYFGASYSVLHLGFKGDQTKNLTFGTCSMLGGNENQAQNTPLLNAYCHT